MQPDNTRFHLQPVLLLAGLYPFSCAWLEDSDAETPPPTTQEAVQTSPDLTSKTVEAPPAAPPAPPEPAVLTGDTVVILGGPEKLTRVFASMAFISDEDGADTEVGPVIREVPAGTRGIWDEPVYGMLITFGAKIKFADGTTGYVDINDLGLLQRVVNVRSDDTLNVRAGQSHKTQKLTEIPPRAPVFVGGWDATSPAGCEGMTGTEKWWSVRTLDGVEGYVNCRYVGEF